MQTRRYKIIFSDEFDKIVKKLRKRSPDVFKKLEKQIIKVSREPIIGKPLRNVLKNYRRVHIDPFVLLYEIHQNEIKFLDFDHHDKIYKKYR